MKRINNTVKNLILNSKNEVIKTYVINHLNRAFDMLNKHPEKNAVRIVHLDLDTDIALKDSIKIVCLCNGFENLPDSTVDKLYSVLKEELEHDQRYIDFQNRIEWFCAEYFFGLEAKQELLKIPKKIANICRNENYFVSSQQKE